MIVIELGGGNVYIRPLKNAEILFSFFFFSFLLFYMLSPHYEMKPDLGRHSMTNGI